MCLCTVKPGSAWVLARRVCRLYDVPITYPTKYRMTMTSENKKPATKTRMSRAQIVEGLDQFPIGVLLAGTGKKNNLTHKEKAFAHALAIGDSTKADAYRKAYNTKAKPKHVGNDAHKLSMKPKIVNEVEAIRLALDATKYQNAGQIKALVVHQLTRHALNEDNPPAQRIRALELLGKTHEVGLFVERREVTTINSSVDIKARLLDQLKTFIRADVEDVQDKGADSLLAELAGENTPTPALGDQATPLPAPPPELDGLAVSQDTHSIPLNQSNEKSNQSSVNINNQPSQVIDFIEENFVTPNVWSEKQGEGVSNFPIAEGDIPTETPPLDDSGSPTMGRNNFRVK